MYWQRYIRNYTTLYLVFGCLRCTIMHEYCQPVNIYSVHVCTLLCLLRLVPLIFYIRLVLGMNAFYVHGYYSFKCTIQKTSQREMMVAYHSHKSRVTYLSLQNVSSNFFWTAWQKRAREEVTGCTIKGRGGDWKIYAKWIRHAARSSRVLVEQ